MAFHSLLVKVLDDTLPSPIRTAETIAVGGESFLWHGPSELFYQPPTLPHSVCLCPDLCALLCRKKPPRLLVEVNPPITERFLFSEGGWWAVPSISGFSWF